MPIDGRSFPHDVLEKYRYAAVRLHRAGVDVETIAASFKITRQAVYRWLKRAENDGLWSLRAAKAEGRACLLSPQQVKELRDLVRLPATKLGYSTDLWSGPRVRQLIKQKFKITYHAKHMPRLLKQVGLVLRFPERRSLDQDPKKVKEWKKRRLPEILAYARQRRGLVFYADEALVSLIPYVGKSWVLPKRARGGKRDKPIVRVSGRRGQHVGATAAVNQQGRMCFELTKAKERFTSKVFIRFMKKLRAEYPSRRIVLIVDGAKVHKSKAVKEFEKSNKTWLRLEILPAYSPELNPTEKSWRFVKTMKLNGCAAKDKVELRKITRKAMRSTKKDAKRVTSFFDDL